MAKTIRVADIIRMVNVHNHCSICPPDVRKGRNSLLEEILAATDNYVRLGYLSESEVPRGQAPGISEVSPNCTFPDDTRCAYVFDRKLLT